MAEVHRAMHALFEEGDVPRKLRALWVLKVTGGLDEPFLLSQLEHESEYLRAWAVKLLCEDRQPSQTALHRFELLAADGESPYVRLHLCSALQRLDYADRWEIAEALASRGEDAGDQNLPLMLWYAVEPLIADDRERQIRLAGKTEIPLVRKHIARRALEDRDHAGAALTSLLSEVSKSESAAVRLDLLHGILTGLEGRRRVAMPEIWPATYATLKAANGDPLAAKALAQGIRLALIFDDQSARAQLIAQAADGDAKAADRRLAIESLVEAKVSGIEPILFDLLADRGVQASAVRGLARYQHEATADKMLDAFAMLDNSAQQAALQTLASRTEWAAKLLDAVEAGSLDRSLLDAVTARQLSNLNDAEISARLQTLWGTVRSTPKDRARRIAELKGQLTGDVLAGADLAAGRKLFEKTCGKCHVLFGEGGKIGPDITGAQRHNLDYLLENIVDPSAAVSRDWLTEVVQTTDGQIISGLLVSETESAVTIQTVDEKIVLPADEIAARRKSSTSMMPDGILKPLSAEEIRDLVGYLQRGESREGVGGQ